MAMMFGGRSAPSGIQVYNPGAGQAGAALGRALRKPFQDKKYRDWKEGVQAVEEDSGDPNHVLDALWRGAELGDDRRVQAVMQQLIPQYQGVIDQRAAAEEAARADAERNKNFDRAQQIAAGGDRVGAIQWLVRQGMDAGDATKAFPEEKDPRTTLQKNYDAAVKQGYPGTLMDYQKDTRPGGDTILLGDGPRGTGLAYDAENQMEPKKDFSFRWKDPNDTSQGIVRDEYGLPKQFALPGTEGTVSEAEAKANNILFAGERIMETVTPEMLEAQGGSLTTSPRRYRGARATISWTLTFRSVALQYRGSSNRYSGRRRARRRMPMNSKPTERTTARCRGTSRKRSSGSSNSLSARCRLHSGRPVRT